MPSESIAGQLDVQGYLDVLRRAEDATGAEQWADAAAAVYTTVVCRIPRQSRSSAGGGFSLL